VADGRQQQADGHPVGRAAGRAGGVALLAEARCRRSAGWPITEVLLVAVCYAIGPLIASRKAERAPARRHDRCMPGIRCRRLFTAGSTAWTSAGLSVLSGERPDVLSVAGMVLTAPAIVAVAVSAARLDAAQLDRSDSATAAASAAGVPGTDEDARTSVVNRRWTGVFWGLAAGAGFAMFLIGLNRAGSSQDLWPVGIADLAGVITTVGVAAVAGQLALPAAGTRRLSLLTGIIGAVGALSVFLATHRGLLAVTAVIYSLYPAGTIILARVRSDEHLTRAGMFGLCLAATSVSLIAAGAVR
jgi:hypothetical protein